MSWNNVTQTYEVKVWDDGTKEWFLNGKLHREDGPAIEWADGSKKWYINGKCHREDGPALELANGAKHWYLNGKLHREDGPAIEWANGPKYWSLDGKPITEEEHWKATNSTCDGREIEIDGVTYVLKAKC